MASLRVQCVAFRGIHQIWKIILIIIIISMFPLLYNHLKIGTVVFLLPWNEPIMSTYGEGPLHAVR